MQFNLSIRSGTANVDSIQYIIGDIYKAASSNSIAGVVSGLNALNELDKTVKFIFSIRKNNKVLLNNNGNLIGEELNWVIKLDVTPNAILFAAPQFAAGRNSDITCHLVRNGNEYKLYKPFAHELLKLCDNDNSVVGIDLCVDNDTSIVVVKDFLEQNIIGSIDSGTEVLEDGLSISAVISLLLNHSLNHLRKDYPELGLGELLVKAVSD